MFDRVGRIGERERELARSPDSALVERFAAIRERIASRRRVETRSGDPDATQSSGRAYPETVEALFALVREVSRRTLGLRHHDVQLAAGLAMADGKLAELATGEGKTLAAVPAACLLALAGSGVHVLTFNDYLAGRDAAWMSPVYRTLGLSVAAVTDGLATNERRAAYAADVTYLTAQQAGFDYLRDGLALAPVERVQRRLHSVLVDEADSILIDEARVPLVIAGSLDAETADPAVLARIVRALEPGRDFATDRELRNVHLTDIGLARVEAALGIDDLYADGRASLVAEVQNALHAQVLLQADVDYIVRSDRVELVDERTGRVVDDRLWPDGLQAALEAKEGVGVRPEGRVLAQTTLQHLIERYEHRCGMTATVGNAAEELHELYGLEVVALPPHRPCIREDRHDRVFADDATRISALRREIEQVHSSGQPVLVGTASVAASESLAADLRQRGIDCAVLNARNDAQEAAVIAEAGRIGAVTISTNMAGRGTDIRLGGADGEERDKVVELGGLHVIGVQRHASRRIDDQLRGRAGRQGDPGSSRFFVSLDDELFRRYGSGSVAALAARSGGDGTSFIDRLARREIARAQRVVEGQHFDIRRTLNDYSQLVNRQYESLRAWRTALLEGEAETELFRKGDPGRHRELSARFGSDALARIEREVSLHAIDRAFSDHLGRLNEIRDAIHLSRAAGRSPLDEFHRRAGAAFEDLVLQVEDDVAQAFDSVAVVDGVLALRDDSLTRPSSTWTYTVNDDPFELNPMAAMSRNIGLATGMAILWPLLLAWGLLERMRRRA